MCVYIYMCIHIEITIKISIISYSTFEKSNPIWMIYCININ